MTHLLVTVDNRLRLPADAPQGLIKRLKQGASHPNPEYSKKQSMGFWVGHVDRMLKTWAEQDGSFSLARGCTTMLRTVAAEMGVQLRFDDKRVTATASWSPLLIKSRGYQERGIEACVTRQQGIVRAPTGSGKTHMALGVLPEINQRALVIVRDSNLLKQWVDRAHSSLGLRTKDIGVVQGSKRRIGTHLTLALQQTLYSKNFPIDEFAKQFGAVVVDEVQDAAARTVNETINAFPARVRLGFSADHTRKDRKECLIEDAFGEVIYEVGKKDLETSGDVVPVVVRLVPTDFRADWYANAPPEERDFVKLIAEMSESAARNLVIRQVVLDLVAQGNVPALVFTNRRSHAQQLAERDFPADGVPSGLLLGSAASAEMFAESKELLLSGVLKVAVGTFKAVGQGIDIPNVLAGVCATPVGKNRQFFGQVRGRICRVVPGKRVGHLYYLWDRHVFPEAPRNLLSWNDGLVEVFDSRGKSWVAFR